MPRIDGTLAEKKAQIYLMKQGLKFITANYSCRFGEIDLIMQDKNFLVFIEVRARQSLLFGRASATVNFHKKQKILKTASHYLTVKKYDFPVRFDIISIEGKEEAISWIKDAFGLNY